jgi:hypothetical protein
VSAIHAAYKNRFWFEFIVKLLKSANAIANIPKQLAKSTPTPKMPLIGERGVSALQAGRALAKKDE